MSHRVPNKLAWRRYWTGIWLALGLSLSLMVVTAAQSLVTFLTRMYSSDVMLGAIGNITLLSQATIDIAGFVGGVVLVHLLFALVVHGLAVLAAVAWPAGSRSRHGLVVLWFALLLAALLLQNAVWFPRSHMGDYYHDIAVSTLGPVTVTQAIWALVVTLVLLTVSLALLRIARSWTSLFTSRAVAAATAIALSAAGLWMLFDTRGAAASGSDDRPNVIILGVDSLRLEYLRRFDGVGETPRLDAVLEGADLFSDTTTPLARTFPSWVSILTGRTPRATGARFNLVHRPSIQSKPTLADLLSEAGYETYYATDEVRFSNIDESYGFDHVITPPIGAADFLIGRTADLPLSNVLANSILGGTLLAYLHGNRAVANLYRPRTFLARLGSELEPRKPVFAAIHLTAAHWPYYHADTPRPEDRHEVPESDFLYREAVQTADAMFGDVMQMLRAKGLLDNAIVIVLSDHGEAIQRPQDVLVSEQLDGRVAGLEVPVRIVDWGHGQSVLSPVQFQVLLSFRGFGQAAGTLGRGRTHDVPASLLDVFPTMLDLLGIQSPLVDGVSLAPWLRDTKIDQQHAERRTRFTETDIRVIPTAGGAIDEDKVAAEAARLFGVDPTTGWLHLRHVSIPMLLKFKERAAIGPTQILAAMPVAPDRHEYLLIDRRTGMGRVLQAPPLAEEEEAARLWEAMHEYFADELQPPIIVQPADVPTYAAGWSALRDQQTVAARGE